MSAIAAIILVLASGSIQEAEWEVVSTAADGAVTTIDRKSVERVLQGIAFRSLTDWKNVASSPYELTLFDAVMDCKGKRMLPTMSAIIYRDGRSEKFDLSKDSQWETLPDSTIGASLFAHVCGKKEQITR